MDFEEDIRSALVGLECEDILGWARTNVTRSLAELTETLGAAVPPVAVQRFMAKVARESGRYDEFVRTEAVRKLNEFFPKGFGQSDKQQYGLAAGWAMWVGLIEASHRTSAEEVWKSLSRTLQQFPDWTPRGADDPRVLAAFDGHCFEPTDGAKRLAVVESRLYREVGKDNKPFSHDRVLQNLRGLPPGYGLIYGVNVLDGLVCNGGFIAYYEGTEGTLVPHAVEGYLALGRADLANLVRESVLAARRWHPRIVKALRGYDVPAMIASPRPFDQLEEVYYASNRKGDWLELALVKLVTTRADLF